MFNILVITDNKLSSLNQCNSVVNELKRISNKKIAVEYIEVYLGLLAYLPNFLIFFFLKIRYLFESIKNKKPTKVDGVDSLMGRLDCKEPSVSALYSLCKQNQSGSCLYSI